MPELPEVEITCQGIKNALLGQTIQKVVVRQASLRWPVPIELEKLKNAKITHIDRRAKYILIKTSKGTLINHLGMSGKLRVLAYSLPPQKHDHVDILFKDNSLLRYTDPRRFGAMLWTTQDPLQHTLLINLGPEPFDKAFTGKYLFQKIQSKTSAIKALLMDQQVVVGVGNIYATEALFFSKISPLRPAHTLTLSECTLLVKNSQKILKKAIEKGGTTLKDFLSPEGKAGYFVQQLFAYGREGEHCLQCETTLQNVRITQRSSVFCPHCQI